MTGQRLTDTELQELAAIIKRMALARGLNHDASDDVAQETLSRLLTAGDRIAPDARRPFALTIAGNLIADDYRRDQRDRNHRHRLIERDEDGPESGYLAAEQAAAVRAALDSLPFSDRQLLVDHAEGRNTRDLAEASRSTPSAIAARLARTRARLRLDYLLALRRVNLPTDACRRVLLAISGADQRRLKASGAAAHLGGCQTCSDLAAPLAERRSRLAGIAIAPLVALGAFGGRLHRAAKSHAVQAAAGTTVAVAAVVAVAAAQPHAAPPARSLFSPIAGVTTARGTPSSQPTPATAFAARGIVLTASGIHLLPLPPAETLRSLVGQHVIVSDMAVQLVASHPGFWIGTQRQRIYVDITDPATVRRPLQVGQRVSFNGELQANPPGFANADGVDQQEGSAALSEAGVHLTVRAADLVITINGASRTVS